MNITLSKTKSHYGFTLIEVLSSLIIISLLIAFLSNILLDISKQRENSLYFNNALMLSEEIITRVRLSRRYAREESIDYQNNPYLNSSIWQNSNPIDCSSISCSGSNLAAFDGYEVFSLAEKQLPNPHIELSRCHRLFCLSIFWSDALSNECDMQEQNNCLSMTFF